MVKTKKSAAAVKGDAKVVIATNGRERNIQIHCGLRGGGSTFTVVGAKENFKGLWDEALGRAKLHVKMSQLPITDIDIKELEKEWNEESKDIFFQFNCKLSSPKGIVLMDFNLTTNEDELEEKWVDKYTCVKALLTCL